MAPEKSAFGKAIVLAGLGIEFAGIIGASALSGYFLDEWLQTAPVFIIVLVVTGTIGLFVRIVHIMRQMEKREDDSR